MPHSKITLLAHRCVAGMLVPEKAEDCEYCKNEPQSHEQQIAKLYQIISSAAQSINNVLLCENGCRLCDDAKTDLEAVSEELRRKPTP